MNKFKTLSLLALIILFAGIFSAKADYPFADVNRKKGTISLKSPFTGGKGYYQIGYLGLGTKNEALFFAEYKQQVEGPVTLSYKLNDNNNGNNIKKYIKNIVLFAREYKIDTNIAEDKTGLEFQLQDGQDKFGTTRPGATFKTIPTTYLHSFDPRGPIEKGNVIGIDTRFLGVYPVPSDKSETKITTTVNLPAGNWVIYLCVDVKSFEVIDEKALPYMYTETGEQNFTQIGGQITKIGETVITATKAGDLQSTYGNDNDYQNMSDATWTSIQNQGSRVLVPRRQIIYAPGDFYSKFYRIPAITTTGNGSLMAISDARKYHIHDISNDIDQVARFSHDFGQTWSKPINIYKGTSPDGHDYCPSAKGYGDAAVAKLPNGSLLVVTTSGGPLQTTATPNFYKISYNEGKSWTKRKPLNTSALDLSNRKGCIAPGNMCVVKGGYYAGKVLALYREVGSRYNTNYLLCYSPDTDVWSVLETYVTGNGTVTYQKEVWPKNTSNGDEAHLIEISKNKFLMSTRNNATEKRLFSWLDVVDENETIDVNGNIIKLKAGTFGMYTRSYTIDDVKDKQLNAACNADALSYQTRINNSEKPYIIQPLVTKSFATYYSHDTALDYYVREYYNTRSGLTLHYSNNYNNTNLEHDATQTINFKSSIQLGDPFGDALNENTQYCSLTEQADGTVGLLFEEYPFGVRKENSKCGGVFTTPRGDFLMNITYMNLRIGDIIPGASISKKIRLEAPNVDPNSRIYDINTPDKWGELTISHINDPEVFTHYRIEYQAPGTEIFKTVDMGNDKVSDFFQGKQSHTISWKEVSNYVPQEVQTKGLVIRVSAWCTPSANMGATHIQSYVDTELYTFDHPIYKIRLKSYPSGVGNVLMSVQNVEEYHDSEIGQVANKMRIRLTSSGDAGFKFDSYQIAANSNLAQNLSAIQNISFENITDDGSIVEFVFNAEFGKTETDPGTDPLENAIEGDVYTIYAVFKGTGTTGLNTKVSTLAKGYIAKGTVLKETDYNEKGEITAGGTVYGHSYWITKNANGQEAKEFIDGYDTPNNKLDLGEPEKRDNASEDRNKVMFANYEAPYLGIHANVQVLPDAFTSQYYGAVIALRQGEGAAAHYLKWQPYTYNPEDKTITYHEDERYVYSLLNSALRNFTPAMAKKAYSVEDWSTLHTDGISTNPVIANNTPADDQFPCAWNWGDSYFAIKKMNGVKFPRIDKYNGFDNAAFKEGQDLFIDIFVTSPAVGSVEEVIENGRYLFKTSHAIVYDGSVTTDVEDIEGGAKLSVRSAKGGVLLNTTTPVNVHIVNTMGMTVKDFELTDTEYVELPQGIYIANGIKFAVY